MNSALIFFGSEVGLAYGGRVVTRISYHIRPNLFRVRISTARAAQTKIRSNQFLPCVLNQMLPYSRMRVHSMAFKAMGHGCGDFISIALSFNAVQLSSKVFTSNRIKF